MSDPGLDLRRVMRLGAEVQACMGLTWGEVVRLDRALDQRAKAIGEASRLASGWRWAVRTVAGSVWHMTGGKVDPVPIAKACRMLRGHSAPQLHPPPGTEGLQWCKCCLRADASG